jgi:hypothetical protein
MVKGAVNILLKGREYLRLQGVGQVRWLLEAHHECDGIQRLD